MLQYCELVNIITLKPEEMRKEGFREDCDWSCALWGGTQASMGTWTEGRGKEKSGFTSNSDITYKLGEMQASDERFTIILQEKIVNRKHKNYYKIRPFKKKFIDR